MIYLKKERKKYIYKMFDEIALVQSDEESPFVQSNPKPAKTI